MNNKECPICHEETDHYIPVVWDFHSNMPQSENYHYYQCFHCGCFFLDEFRNWTPEMYSERIYNADYAKTDPAFNGLRAYILLLLIGQQEYQYHHHNQESESCLYPYD